MHDSLDYTFPYIKNACLRTDSPYDMHLEKIICNTLIASLYVQYPYGIAVFTVLQDYVTFFQSHLRCFACDICSKCSKFRPDIVYVVCQLFQPPMFQFQNPLSLHPRLLPFVENQLPLPLVLRAMSLFHFSKLTAII